MKKICEYCGKEFNGRKEQKYCSRECYNKDLKPKHEDLTGMKFGRLTVVKFDHKKGKKTYWLCKCDCGNTKLVRSDCLKQGQVQSCGCLKKEQNYKNLTLYSKAKEITYIDKICPHCGKHFTVEKTDKNRKFCSQECAYKHSRGENSPHWKPNLTQEEREIRRDRNLLEGYSVFIREVLKRDNYTCQVTGKRGKDLVVHHLYSYNKYPCLRIVMENGITISKEVHKEFHSIYGYGDNTLEQWNEFIENRNREAS